MSVDPEITRQILQEEVKSMAALASSYKWEVTQNPSDLTVTVKMVSVIDQQKYIVEARCDGYKAIPPYFEFLHPETQERSTKRCYPSGGSFFHPTPCICVQWNRKSYRDEGGPHGDWAMAAWLSARPGTTTLGDMFHLIQKEINRRGQYRGRMA